MPRYNKQEDFEAGIEQVTPFFVSRGYVRTIVEPFRDRNTLYAARFDLWPRSVELHHEFSLGPVIYRMGDYSIEHTPYLQALGVASAAHYPSYRDDAQAGYLALLHDLQTLLVPFFTGSIEAFAGPATAFMEQARQKAIDEERRSAYWGSLEQHSKAKARDLFFQKQYDEVVRIASKIRFPEFLTESERRLFALARKRANK